MDDRELNIKRLFVATVMEKNWAKEDIILELLQHLSDKDLDSLWLDLSLSVQEEELQERGAA